MTGAPADFRDLMDDAEARAYRDGLSQALSDLEDAPDAVEAFRHHVQAHAEDCDPLTCDWCAFRIEIDRRSNGGV